MTWDVIVIGCGGFGAACLSELSVRGLRVLGLDQFQPPHDRGSSHGETRIIRKAYFEHPDYVPLLHRAWDLWAELSDRCGGGLLNPCDLVMTGTAESEVIRGARESAAEHSLRVENLTAAEGRARYPVLAIPETHEVVVEETAGWLAVERCVSAQLEEARIGGAELKTGVHVKSLRGSASGVEIETSAGRFSAGAAIVNCGPWTGRLLPEYAPLITVLRKTLFWYEASGGSAAARGYPMFLMDLPAGQFYGVPSGSPAGMKVGEHSGGDLVADPGEVRRELSAADVAAVDEFVRGQLLGLKTGAVRGAVCQYSMSPDGHFLMDRHVELPVVVNAGFSGHGFKFTPVIAEAAVDLVERGRTELPVGFLSRDRFERN
ncbi:MAG: N-methyl-L-tryptophan oxidase [Planctomycetaceae bacterium]